MVDESEIHRLARHEVLPMRRREVTSKTPSPLEVSNIETAPVVGELKTEIETACA